MFTPSQHSKRQNSDPNTFSLAISQRLEISARTLQRHLAAAGARKGAVMAEVLLKAKDELPARITSDQTIKEEVTRLVADDLAHSSTCGK